MIDTKSLRKKILEQAFSGQLYASKDCKGNSRDLIKRISEEKERLVKEKKISKIKSLTPIKDDEKIFTIPDDWEYVKLGLLSLPLSDGVHYAPEYQDAGYKCFSAKDIYNNRINDDDCTYITEEEYIGMKGKINVQEGSILITKSGSIGRSTVVKEYFEFGLVESIGVINPIIVNPEYIKYVLDYGFVYSSYYSDKYTRGVGLKHLTLTLLENIPIPLPNVEEQGCIVDILNSTFTLLDVIDDLQAKYSNDLAVLKSKIIDAGIRGKLTEHLPEDGDSDALYLQIQEKKAKLIKKGIIKKAKILPPFSDDDALFDIPSNWRWVRLGDVSSIISKGTTPKGGKAAYLDSGIGFLRVENLAGYNKLDTSSLKYIDKETHNGYLKRSILEAGDVLISIAGTLGRTALVREDDLPLNANQAIAFIRIVEQSLVDVEYISYILNASTVQKELANKKVTMAIPNLSLDVISKTMVPLPPYAEQKRIVEIIKQFFTILNDIDEGISNS